MVRGMATMCMLLVRCGILTPGVVLILTGTLLCITVQYAHFWFVLEAVGLVAVGPLFVLTGALGEAYFIACGLMVSGVMVVGGVVEGILSRQSRRG